MHKFVANSPFAQAQVRGDAPGYNTTWGLPDKLYGVDVVVEDAVKVTSKKGATDARDFTTGGDTAYLIARPGGLVGVEGSPSFSFLQLFMYEEMGVESKDDPDNRRTNGRVVEMYDVRVVSPIAGCRATDVVT